MTRSGHLRVAGLALVAVVLIVPACSSGGSETTTTTESSTTVAPTTAAPGPPPGAIETGWDELVVGSCFDLIDDNTVDDLAVWLIGCAAPHRYEVFEILDYDGETDQGAYPGVAVVQNWAEEACFNRFEAFVGVRWTVSELDIATWWPSEESWARGDTSVICAVMDNSGRRLEGSQRDSQR